MGQEITIQLALRQKPAAFGIEGKIEPEVIPNALNAVRLFGHSQILVEGYISSWRWQKNNPNSCKDEDLLVEVCERITAMQIKDEKIEITTTPATPEERKKAGFCRIDLHLKK
jgi:hypothetical protein